MRRAFGQLFISCHRGFYSPTSHSLKEKEKRKCPSDYVLLCRDPSALRCQACLKYSTSSFPTRPGLPLLTQEGRPQPYLSMLMAQRFRMLAVHIMTSRVTKMSQQTRLKFHTPPVTWASETRMSVFSPPNKLYCLP